MKKQQSSDDHECSVGNHREGSESLRPSKNREYARHDDVSTDLSNFNAGVESQQPRYETIARQAEVLQPCGKAKAVDRAECEYHAPHVWRIHSKPVTETIEVLKTLVDDRDRDRGVDAKIVGLEPEQCRAALRKAVADGKYSDTNDNRGEAGMKNMTPNRKSS